MSRIGKMPVVLPSSVKAAVVGQMVSFEGPKGKASREVRPEVQVKLEDGKIILTRAADDGKSRAFHGLERALLANISKGVSEGWTKELELIGVGYRADMKGKDVLNLELGYSHEIDFPIPAGITATVSKEGRQIFVKIEGIDKHQVGQVAAEIRALRPPEPYKGKGVRYKTETVRRKAGKSGKK